MVLIVMLTLLIISCGQKQSDVENDLVTVTVDQLELASNGDMLEMADSSAVFVSNQISGGLRILYVTGGHQRINFDNLAERVTKIVPFGSPEWCLAAEKYFSTELF